MHNRGGRAHSRVNHDFTLSLEFPRIMLGVTRVSTLSDVEENSSSFDGDPLATVDKTMRSIDEGKVHDCKEDMDTLLVFAGLYSAVLTSFLVQSYQNLLEDPQQVTVNLLRQISLQTSSYELTNGFLTSTVSPASPPTPFQAAGADIRINVCWFASLILSLSTASFGILVKQWLREYLAIDRTVPQERLRILYFRARGLEQWRLYDIAAALPLMLQLSLALFFVGLCFFTGEIHPAVRATSLCLVGGWAILFGFAFVAPLVSARCPYKTTFLKSAFRRARPRVRAFVMSLTRLGRQLLLRSHSPMLHSLCRVTSTIKKVGRQAVLAVRDCLRAADYEAQMERNDQTFADNAVAARHSDLARHNHHIPLFLKRKTHNAPLITTWSSSNMLTRFYWTTASL
ncbi:hypothetical protein NM688_g8307 [Phlebia brevispora]|uniref:Uncharacterized protein n=1 Tax=Phlebia brevispora TaxID=194682 RepID=A0ACC1RTX6_9APHY|nr:hypothetical protein NM688_g8307 [Phlebia brevispora]